MKLFSLFNLLIISTIFCCIIVLLRYYIIDFNNCRIKIKSKYFLAKYTDLELKDIVKYIEKNNSEKLINKLKFERIISYRSIDTLDLCSKMGDNNLKICKIYNELSKCKTEVISIGISENTPKLEILEKIKKIEKLKELRIKETYELMKESYELILSHAEEERNGIIEYSQKLLEKYNHRKYRPFKLRLVLEDLGKIRNNERKIILNNIIQYILKSRTNDTGFNMRIKYNKESTENVFKIINSINDMIKCFFKNLIVEDKDLEVVKIIDNNYNYNTIIENYLKRELNLDTDNTKYVLI